MRKLLMLAGLAALLAGCGERGGIDVRAQWQEVVREVEPAEDCADDRHDKIVDDGVDDLAESGTDNNTHGKVHDIAAGNEGFKFVKHSDCPSRALRAEAM